MTTELASKTTKTGFDVRTREKIIYKLIPIPYYFPVPADAEWYHEKIKPVHNDNGSSQEKKTLNLQIPHPGLNRNDADEIDRKNVVSSTAGKNLSGFPAGEKAKVDTIDKIGYSTKEEEIKRLNSKADANCEKLTKTQTQEIKPQNSPGYNTIPPTTIESEQQILIHNSAIPGAMPTMPGGNPAPGYTIPGMHGVPLMIPGGMPYMMVPMQNPPLHLQPAQVRATFVPQSNTGTKKQAHSPSPPPPPRRLPPPHMVVDTTKLASDELNSFKEDMRHWKMEAPKEREKFDQHHQGGRRSRTVFTRHQLITLNSIFKKQSFISGKRMRELSDELGLDRKTIKIWFQNKRQYLRRKASPRADASFTNEEDYQMYRDISGSEVLHRPPTMTGKDTFNDIKENLDFMGTEQSSADENNEKQENDILDSNVYNDDEIITVEMK